MLTAAVYKCTTKGCLTTEVHLDDCTEWVTLAVWCPRCKRPMQHVPKN